MRMQQVSAPRKVPAHLHVLLVLIALRHPHRMHLVPLHGSSFDFALQVQANYAAVKTLMGQWEICGLGDGEILGSGYNYVIRTAQSTGWGCTIRCAATLPTLPPTQVPTRSPTGILSLSLVTAM